MFACRSSGERSPIWLQPLNPANDPPPTAQSPSTQTQKPRIETAPSVPGPTVNSTVQRDTEELNTAAVARRDLADTEEFPGTLGFGDPEPLHPNASGVVACPMDVLDAGIDSAHRATPSATVRRQATERGSRVS